MARTHRWQSHQIHRRWLQFPVNDIVLTILIFDDNVESIYGTSINFHLKFLFKKKSKLEQIAFDIVISLVKYVAFVFSFG